MQTHKTPHFILAALLVLLVPSTAIAYLNPYDVLLSEDLLLPSTSREAESRVERQQRESASRREREQEAIFLEQNPSHSAAFEEDFAEFDEFDFENEDELLRAAAPDYDYADAGYIDNETLSLIRALDRIKRNEEKKQLRNELMLLLDDGNPVVSGDMPLSMDGENLHAGAPLQPMIPRPLASTGTGTVLMAILMIVTMAWTLGRSKKSVAYVRKDA